MKGQVRFTVFAAIFIVLLGVCVYAVAYAAGVSGDIAAGTYTGSFFTETKASAAIWIFSALAVLSVAGIISSAVKGKAVYAVFIAFFAALFALSGYLGFEHLKSMLFNVTNKSIIILAIFAALIILSVIGVIVNALILAKRPDI